MTITTAVPAMADTPATTINPKFAAALVAVGAFLATHPDLPVLGHLGFGPEGEGVIVYASNPANREQSPDLAESYAAAWAAALGTAPDTRTYTARNGVPYVNHTIEAQVVPGVTVYASFAADLEPADTAPALR